MSCAEIRDRLDDRIYGLLEERDAEEVDRHVAACAECAREMQAARGRDELLDLWKPEVAAAGPVRLRARRAPAWIAVAAGLLVALGAGLFPVAAPYDAAPGEASAARSVRLGAAGRLEVEGRIVLREGGEGLDHVVELAAGTVRAEVFPTGRAFRVSAGEVTVDAKGTRFLVSRLGGAATLVAVAAGAVLVTTPGGAATVETGRAAVVTPAGIEKVEAGTSLEAAQKIRDELARAIAEREEKNRKLREAVAALRGKHGPVEIPPGATLKSLMEALAEAVRGRDSKAIERAVDVLALFVDKDPAAFDALLGELASATDLLLAQHLVNALCSAGDGMKVADHKAAVLKLLLAPGIGIPMRRLFVGHFAHYLAWRGDLKAADLSSILRVAQALHGSDEDTRITRELLAAMAAQRMVPEAWGDFERYLAGEADAKLRDGIIEVYLQYGAARDGSAGNAEALIFDSLRGRYGPASALQRVAQPLVKWFRPENGAAFSGALRQAAALHPDPAGRQGAAGQLATLYLLQKTPEALEAFRQVHASEPDAAARGRMGEVLRSLEKGELDMDALMDRLQLEWKF